LRKVRTERPAVKRLGSAIGDTFERMIGFFIDVIV
jgi:hypothetical protein